MTTVPAVSSGTEPLRLATQKSLRDEEGRGEDNPDTPKHEAAGKEIGIDHQGHPEGGRNPFFLQFCIAERDGPDTSKEKPSQDGGSRRENEGHEKEDHENEETRKAGGKVLMVLDFKLEAMVMFNEYGGQKMAMLTKLKDPSNKKITDKDRNYTYKEVGTKTILGFECYGIEIENKNSFVTLWFTLDAPVNFSAFFAFSSEAAPKGFSDPQLFDVLKDEALLMEMQMINKKKTNQKMIMTAISLEEKKTEIHKKDYQFMKMGF